MSVCPLAMVAAFSLAIAGCGDEPMGTGYTPCMSNEEPSSRAAEGNGPHAARQKPRKRGLFVEKIWPALRMFGEILYYQIARDRTFTQAAAFTYKTLFSLVPIFVLSLLVLSRLPRAAARTPSTSPSDR